MRDIWKISSAYVVASEKLRVHFVNEKLWRSGTIGVAGHWAFINRAYDEEPIHIDFLFLNR